MASGFIMGFPNTSSGVVQQTDGGLLYDSNGGNMYGIAQTSGTGENGFCKWGRLPERERAAGAQPRGPR